MRISISRSRTENVRWIALFSTAVLLGICVGLVEAQVAQPPTGSTAPAAATPAPAQPPRQPVAYNNATVDENLKNERPAVNRLLSSGQLGPGNQAKLDEYYKKYALARWANSDYVHDLGRNRKELKNEMRICGRSGRPTAVHDYMLDLCRSVFGGVAKGNYHPACRYNAMLMIGDLNRKESSPGVRTEPLAEAIPLLLDALSDASQPDVVRIAALIGIRRHCGLNIADADVRDNRVYPALRDLAGATEPEGRRSPEGHAWMRVLAIQALVALDGLGPNGEVLDTLGAAASEEDGSMLSRCAAARAFGEFTYTNVAGLALDSTPSLQSLGELGQAICEVELTLLEQMEKQEEIDARRGSGGSAGFMGGMGEMGGMGGAEGYGSDMDGGAGGMNPDEGGEGSGGEYGSSMMGGDGGYGGYGGSSPGKSTLTEAEQFRVDISKRRAWGRLRNVLVGLKGIEPIAVEPNQLALREELVEPINALYAELDKKDDDEEPLDPKSLEKAYKTASSAISEILAGAADPDPAPPATNPGDTAGVTP